MEEYKPKIPKNNRNILKTFFEIAIVLLITTLLFVITYRDNLQDLHIPFSNHGDITLTLSNIKTIQEKGWFLSETNRLGAPFSSNFFDYPTADSLSFFVLKLIVLVVKDPVLTINLFFYLIFLLIAITSYLVFRKLKIKKILCIVGSILFTFSPYHIIRGVNHLFLSSYFTIPIVFLICFWIYRGKLNKKKLLFSFLIMLIVGSTGIYYAFFSVFLLIFTGFLSLINKNNKYLLHVIILSTTICLTVLTCIAPNIIYSHKYGKNNVISNRHPNESEYYGLKISSLFVPNSDYNLTFLKNKIDLYKNSYFKSENTSYLGIIGIIGFLISLIFLFIDKKKNKIISFISYSTIGILLLSVNFGFGSIFSYLISAKIRAYVRISIYLEFLSLLLIIYLLNKIKKKNILILLASLTFIIGFIDQISIKRPSFHEIQNQFINDKNFVEKIEENHKNGLIYQLPYKKFPESEPINQLSDYDLLNIYVHSKTLKSSYGAIKGRVADKWNIKLNNLSTIDFINELCILDFNGIYIDRLGYEDNGIKIETEIEKIIKEKPIISDNKRLSFFDLNKYKTSYLKTIDQNKLKSLKEKYLETIEINLENCYETEIEQDQSWQWCQKEGKIKIYNYSDKKRFIKLEFDLIVDPKDILITNQNNQIDILSSKTKNHFYLETEINAGQNTLTFKTKLNQIEAKNDQRNLYFQFFNLSHFVK